MSASTLPQGPGRLGLSLALIAAALSGLGGGATAAQTAPPAAHVCASQCLQQRFFAAVEGWRKLAKKMPEQQSHEADLVRELRVVVAPTAVPLLRTQRQLDGHTVIVSAGWLALLDELLRAEAVPQHEKDGKKECLSGYQSSLELALRANRDRAANEPPQALHSWPRLAQWLESGGAPAACSKLKSTQLRSPAVQTRVDQAGDSVVLWLLTRQAARLVALPLPLPQPKAGSSATGSAEAVRWTCSAPVAARAAAAASAPSQAASPSTAARSDPLPSSPDRRAQQALDCYQLEQPRALTWLVENAAVLFDEETVQALRGAHNGGHARPVRSP
jgi:hypothetical protein